MSISRETSNASELSDADKYISIQNYCRDGWQNASIPVVAGSLSFQLAVTYLALLRSCEVREGNLLGPVQSAAIQFAPGFKFGMDLLREIERAGLLAVSDTSRIDAFSFDDGEIDGYYPYKVYRKVLVANPMALVSDISNLALSGKWPETWLSEAEIFWRQLALGEAREYFLFTLEMRRVVSPDSARLDALLKDILRDHSVSQCFRLIMEAGKETSDQMVRKRLRGQQAANFMLESCQRAVDSARIEGRVVEDEPRVEELPQSTVSFVLHSVFLKIGDRGFTSVPAYSNGRIG